jgi:addiction module HigA family antidote
LITIKGEKTMSNQRKNIISHPGEILKEEFLDEMDISVYALSKAIAVSRSRINDIVLGRRSITADTAVRLGHFFDTDPQIWINLQSHYDVVIAEGELDISSMKTMNEIRI